MSEFKSAISPSAFGPSVASASGLPIALFHMPLVNDLSIPRGIGPATFTRATTGTFVDRVDGLVKTAAIDTARFETDGVLIEGASTNLLSRSEEFDDAAWVKTNATVSADSTASPDGNITSDLVIPSAVNDVHIINQNSAVTSGIQYSHSVFVKASGYGFIQMASSSGFDTANQWVNIDLSNGSIGFSGPNPFDSIKVESSANGFFKVSVTATAISTVSGRIVMAVLESDSNFRLPSFIGDTVSGVYFWGAQLEQLPFASSYIPTTTTAVTRAADNLSIDEGNIPAASADYSVSADITSLGTLLSGRTVFSVEGETFRFSRLEDASENNNISFLSSSIPDHRLDSGVKPGESLSKIVCEQNGSGIIDSLYVNGLLTAKDEATFAAGGVKTSISIGSRSSAEYVFAKIKNFRIFDKALTPAQVRAL